MAKRIIGIALLAVAGVSFLLWNQSRQPARKVSGIVEANEIRLGSRVGGRVEQVLVEEGAPVAAGEVLIVLEAFDQRHQLAEARSKAAAATARYEKLQAGFRPEEQSAAAARRDQAQANYDEAIAGPREEEIQEARESHKLAQAQLELAQLTYQRAERLFGKTAIAKEDLDAAASELKVAQATVDARQAHLSMLEKGTRIEQVAAAKANLAATQAEFELRQNGYRAEEIAEAKADTEAAQAAARAIEQRIAELKVVAPCDAVVEAVDLEPGDLTAPDAPVMSLLDRKGMWIRSYVPSAYRGLVERGQKVAIAIDGFGDERFVGHVSYIARQAEFTPSNVQTFDERAKQVFRIKVDLTGAVDQLQPGMFADVLLDETVP